MSNDNNKFKNAKIYTIRCKSDDTLIYVGSTVQPLYKRLSAHKSKSKDPKCENILLYKKMNELDINDFYIELYIDYPCERKEQLTQREGEIIRQIGTLNKNIAGRTDKEWKEENKEQTKKKNKEYREENRGKLVENAKDYYEANKNEINTVHKKYREANKEQRKIYNEANKDIIKEKKKEFYEANKDIIKEKAIKYIESNKDIINERRRNNRLKKN
jgi:hypothetical protein